MLLRVLGHFGDADARADERRIDCLIECNRAARVGGMIVPDERERRLTEVLERHPLAQEFRIHRDAEPLAVRLSRRALERRDQDFVRGARQDGAANDHYMIPVDHGERAPDLFAHAFEEREVDTAVAPARSADADER